MTDSDLGKFTFATTSLLARQNSGSVTFSDPTHPPQAQQIQLSHGLSLKLALKVTFSDPAALTIMPSWLFRRKVSEYLASFGHRGRKASPFESPGDAFAIQQDVTHGESDDLGRKKSHFRGCDEHLGWVLGWFCCLGATFYEASL
ncbi:hypothetical protein G3O06_03090 [Burkholderia sp. Ac-20345]|uniref:hypothetical protein n=1 Tax=Burkholderia sp. Ac-20345 TaxID=2703891 RepID=UPI00197B2975|nr:hypothetical protein [Burkholderia sp. Ac-20345]MBN3776550.1 hypothetical protein [Burkholderia sp. Ac-20345]